VVRFNFSYINTVLILFLPKFLLVTENQLFKNMQYPINVQLYIFKVSQKKELLYLIASSTWVSLYIF